MKKEINYTPEWAFDRLVTVYRYYEDKKDSRYLYQTKEKHLDLAAYRECMAVRFDYTFCITCKYFFKKFKTIHNVPKLTTKRSIILHAFNLGMISEKETTAMLQMIKTINMTMQMYDKGVAEKIAEDIKAYIPVFKTVIAKIFPEKIAKASN